MGRGALLASVRSIVLGQAREPPYDDQRSDGLTRSLRGNHLPLMGVARRYPRAQGTYPAGQNPCGSAFRCESASQSMRPATVMCTKKPW